jgi:hypothetical protein
MGKRYDYEAVDWARVGQLLTEALVALWEAEKMLPGATTKAPVLASIRRIENARIRLQGFAGVKWNDLYP